MSNKVTSLITSNTPLKTGSIVRLKSGSPAMTVGKIETIIICSYFDVNAGSFVEAEFTVDQLEMDGKKIDQSKFNGFG